MEELLPNKTAKKEGGGVLLNTPFYHYFLWQHWQNLSTKWLYTLLYFEGKKLSHFMDKFYKNRVDKKCG